MKKIITILFATFWLSPMFGQVENWVQEVKTANGKEKVDLFNKITEHYVNDSEPYSAKTYASQAIELAENIDYNDGLAVAYFFLGEAENLNNDLKAARKAYKKWYKLRKKYGDSKQLNWATIGMARFYASQERDFWTEYYYKRTLKKTEENSYEEFRVFRAISEYFQYGATKRTERKLNLKKATKYFELQTESGQKIYGDKFGTTNLDWYFGREFQKALDKSNPKLANKIAIQWIKSKSKFASNYQLFRTSKLIARGLFEEESFEEAFDFIDKSLVFIKKDGEDYKINQAYNNAIYIARNSMIFEQALKYNFEQFKYVKATYYPISALNTTIVAILEENDARQKQKAVELIQNWQKTLNSEKDKAAYDWATQNIKLLK